MKCMLFCFLISEFAIGLLAADDAPLVFEAEKYSSPVTAFTYDKLTETAWNIWSKDKDAERKWSGGTVLQSPLVMKDRLSPADGAPPLHTVITGIPDGRYSVDVKMGRALAFSHDGKIWERRDKGNLGIVEISGGVFELWVDDRFAAASPGSSYYDCITFTPLPPHVIKPLVSGNLSARIPEKIGRGLVAVPSGSGVYLGWRLLEDDPESVSFNIYRASGNSVVKLNATPVIRTTDFVDDAPGSGQSNYFVRPVVAGKEGEPSASIVYKPSVYAGSPSYRKIPMRGDYAPQKTAIADLDGDGAYDFVIKQPDINVDPFKDFWVKSAGTYALEAYRSDGEFLWRYDLGWSIEQGIWYSPYVVYDFDGDGKAEVAVKTGSGDPRDADGRVTSGAEYLTILDGMTGAEKVKFPWPSRDDYPDYNYYSRNQIGVAYLDGKTPFIIVERGTYNTIKVSALEYRAGTLREAWKWSDSEDGAEYRGQGGHILRAADIDCDGRDEVILGSAVLDDNGNGLWSTGFGHPDCTTIGDLDQSKPGLEIQYNLEPKQTKNGMCMVTAATGALLWGLQEPTSHVHSSGLCADMDASHPGVESYGGERDVKEKRWVFSAAGELIASSDLGGLAPRAAYWDGDCQRELVANKAVSDFGGPVLGRIEGTVIAVADLDGDWREEIITSCKGEIRIYTTTTPAEDRRVTLMQDNIYRNGVSGFSQGYFQVPGMEHLPVK